MRTTKATANHEGATGPVSRVKSVRKMAAIIRLVAAHDPGGIRLKTICDELGFKSAGAHHLLQTLAAEKLIAFDASTKRYHLALELILLCRSAYPMKIADYCSGLLQRVAEATEDTVILYVRSGFHAICVDRAEGSYPVRALTIDVGDRRPIGYGAGPMALLAYLPDGEVDEILKMNQRAYVDLNLPSNEAALRAQVERSRQAGFVRNNGEINPKVSAVAIPVRNGEGTIVAGVSVVAILERLQDERAATIAALLAKEVSRVTIPAMSLTG